MKIALTATMVAYLFLFFAPATYGQSTEEEAGTPAAESAELARILQKIADGEHLSADDIGKLDNTVIRVDETRIKTGDPELTPLEEEKKIYILKVDRGDLPLQQFLKMQKALLQSQLTVLRVLTVIARHQDKLERRIARTENIQRELGFGLQDIGHGVDKARLDITSTNVDTGEIAGMSEGIAAELNDMARALEGMTN